MSRTLSEEKALKKLGIPDFRHLSKEKAIQLVSMLDRVDPEVAKKALEQYPQSAKVGIQTLVDWKETVGKALVENGKMSTDMMREFDAVLSTLRTLSEDSSLDETSRLQAASLMIEVVRLVNEADKRNKDFILNVLKITGTVSLGVLTIAAAVLGVNIKLPTTGANKA